MSIFSDSDKKSRSSNWLELPNIEEIDISKEFNVSLSPTTKVFGRFSKDEIYSMMEEADLLKIIKVRGYNEFNLEINIISPLDNRIFIKTKDGQILIHLRLKYSDFSLKNDVDRFKMVYIDWLLTQNIKLKPGTHRKELYYGQEYPGLGVIHEITKFIQILTEKLGAHGVFNVPEYFHDAVLFRNKFKYLDPEKEGKFRSLLSLSPKYKIHKISNAIHQEKVICIETNEILHWFYGEMLSPIDPYLKNKVFNEEYFKKVNKIKETVHYSLQEL